MDHMLGTLYVFDLGKGQHPQPGRRGQDQGGSVLGLDGAVQQGGHGLVPDRAQQILQTVERCVA